MTTYSDHAFSSTTFYKESFQG